MGSEQGVEDGNLGEEGQTLMCRGQKQNEDEKIQRKSTVSQVGRMGKQRAQRRQSRIDSKGSDDEDPDWMTGRRRRSKKRGAGKGKQLRYGRDEACTICDYSSPGTKSIAR